MRDARPFLAHHVRERADTRMEHNGADLHVLARWVENLPSGDPRMERIAAEDVLDYSDGRFTGNEESDALIDAFTGGEDPEARERWLDRFADAVTGTSR